MSPGFIAALLVLGACILLIPQPGRGIHRLSTPAQEQSGGCEADLQRRREASFGRQPSRLLTRIARCLAPSLAPSVARSPRLVRLWPLVPTTAVLALLL